MNPVHCCRMSRAGISGTPSFAWRKQAVPGKKWSGLSVATSSMSMSSFDTPASARAALAASRARSAVDVSGSTQCRCRMPVRSTIHSSDVSMYPVSSSLVTTRGGRNPPTPVIRDRTVTVVLLAGVPDRIVGGGVDRVSSNPGVACLVVSTDRRARRPAVAPWRRS